ncbi:MAG TPA: aldehyde dehydrogenase family protein [Gemmatimonadaceae bacterium]|nr:aldehyde dehydrogenase family protein [Gemmatimonadaceae bacterium]
MARTESEAKRPGNAQRRGGGGRLPVSKTPKVYVGGEFIRSESGRTYQITSDGRFFANVPECTRKDVRNAVEAAAAAGAKWAKRTPYNRGQIVYRLAEMLEARSAEMAAAIEQTADVAGEDARAEVSAAVDRLIYYAGWADKYEQVLGNTNPVGGPFFNFTISEPVGIVGVIADDRSPFLALVSQVAPILVSGNAVVALASGRFPYPAIVFGEMLATSDLPGGVLNILTGHRKELVPTFATHTHIRGIDAVVTADERKELALGAAESVKRVRARTDEKELDWSDETQESLYEIRNFVEFKTVWHPIGA